MDGGFAQLRSIGQKDLLAPMTDGGSRRELLRISVMRRGRSCDTCKECARLRGIYRQGGPFHSKESTGRLVDPAMILADYELWKSMYIPIGECYDGIRVRAASPHMAIRGESRTWVGGGSEIAALAHSRRTPFPRYAASRNTPDGGNYMRRDFRVIGLSVSWRLAPPRALITNYIWSRRRTARPDERRAANCRRHLVMKRWAPPALPEFVAVDIPGYRGARYSSGKARESGHQYRQYPPTGKQGMAYRARQPL